MKHFLFSFLGLFIFLSAYSQQPGSLDLTYNPNDIYERYGRGPDNTVKEIIPLNDGKYMLAGAFFSFDGRSVRGIARVLANGAIDTTFNQGVNGTGFNGSVEVLYRYADGKLLAGGAFNFYNGVSYNNVVRLNANGSIDPTFSSPPGTINSVNDLVVQADGKIVIVGNFPNGVNRLNSNGTDDPSFNVGTGVNASATIALEQLSDGSLILGGNFSFYNGTSCDRIVKLNPDGSLNTSFTQTLGSINNDVRDLEVQVDDKIIAVGDFTSFSGTSLSKIGRLNADGSLDISFNMGTGFPTASASQAYRVKLDNQNRIMIVGKELTTFSGQPTKSLIILESNGQLLTSFSPITNISTTLFSLANDFNGKYLIGGNFPGYGSTRIKNHLRFLADGSLDNTFNYTLTATFPVQKVRCLNSEIISLGLSNSQSSEIFIPGLQTSNFEYAMLSGNYIRCNSDGSVINVINIESSSVLSIEKGPSNGIVSVIDSNPFSSLRFLSNSQTYSIFVRKIKKRKSNNNILAAGNFTFTSGGINRIHIMEFTSDGAVVPTFVTPSAISSQNSGFFHSVDTQSDDKIIVGGTVTLYGNNVVPRILRLNANGSFDNSFNSGTGANNTIYEIVTLENDKILIAGLFTGYNGNVANRFASLNADGSFDATFNIGLGPNDNVRKILVQTDGKIILLGDFTQYNGVPANRIVRLNANGTLDNTFNIGAGANNIIFDGDFDAQGRLVIVGNFTKFNGTVRNFTARIQTGQCITNPPVTTQTIVSCTPITWINGNTYNASNNTATFTYQNLQGCDSARINLNLTIVSALNAPQITAVGNTQICSGESVQLNSTTPGIVWSTGAATSSINVTTSGQYFASVSNQCETVNSNTINIVVNPIPVVNIGLSGDTVLCNNEQITLTSSLITGNSWSNGSSNQSITVSTAGNYTLSVTQNGCSAQDNVIITAGSPNEPVISANGPINICEGESVILTSNVLEVSWSNGSNSPFISISQSGTYSATASNDCGSVTSNSITVTVVPQPTPTITFNNGILSTSNTGTFQWLLNYDAISGANGSSYTPIVSGTYLLRLTSPTAQNCSRISNAIEVQVNDANCSLFTNYLDSYPVVSIGVQPWGYVGGHNTYGDKAKAERFNLPANGTSAELEGCFIRFNKVAYDTPNSTFIVRVYSNNSSTNLPSASLGSVTVPYSSVFNSYSEDLPSYIRFPSPISVSSSFYIGINYSYGQGDTISIYCTADGVMNSGNTAYEQFSNNTWSAFDGPQSWNYPSTFWVEAQICNLVTDINQIEEESSFTLFPNPSKESIFISGEIQQFNGAFLEIFNSVGQVVYSSNTDQGINQVEVDIRGLNTGVYFVRISSNLKSSIISFIKE